jgi:hypothetical protein
LLPDLLERPRRVGVITVSAEHLGWDFLHVAGVPIERKDDVVIEAVDADGEFARVFLGDSRAMDVDRARRDVVDAALRLRARAHDITDVVLECTNMPPHARAIEAATGLRTWSLLQSQRLLAPWHERVQEMRS